MKPPEFVAYLHQLAEAESDPVEGFFGPGSKIWKVSREGVLYLGGMRALLLQLAHPKVAQGVADHSSFRQDPIGRAYRTFESVHTILFGTREAAIHAAARTYAIHYRVNGRVVDPLPEAVDDATYQARDPRLLLWVYATLVDATMFAYDTFLQPLQNAEWEQVYQEGKLVARLFGVDECLIPGSLADFRRYMQTMISGGSITVTPTARTLARALIHGTSPLAVLAPSNYVLAAGTLPPKLREAYELDWSLPVRTAYWLGVEAIRRTISRVPPDLRIIPEARRAERRCSRRTGS